MRAPGFAVPMLGLILGCCACVRRTSSGLDEQGQRELLLQEAQESVRRRWDRKLDWSGLDGLPQGPERRFKRACRVVCTALAQQARLPLMWYDPATERTQPKFGIGPRKSDLLKEQLPRYNEALARLEEVAAAPEAGAWADDANLVALFTAGAVGRSLFVAGKKDESDRWLERNMRLCRRFLATYPNPALERWTLSVCPVNDGSYWVFPVMGHARVEPNSRAIRSFVRTHIVFNLFGQRLLREVEAEIEQFIAEGVPRDKLSILKAHLEVHRRSQSAEGPPQR